MLDSVPSKIQIRQWFVTNYSNSCSLDCISTTSIWTDSVDFTIFSLQIWILPGAQVHALGLLVYKPLVASKTQCVKYVLKVSFLLDTFTNAFYWSYEKTTTGAYEKEHFF